jgi:hypothetical protein
MALGRRAAAPLAVDAGVVDHGVHAPQRVDLVRYAAGFDGAAKIAHHDASGPGREVGERRSAIRSTGVQDHLLARVKKRPGRRAAEPVGAPCDEDARHPSFLIALLIERGIRATGARAALATLPGGLAGGWSRRLEQLARGARSFRRVISSPIGESRPPSRDAGAHRGAAREAARRCDRHGRRGVHRGSHESAGYRDN